MSDLRTLLHEAAGPSDTTTSNSVADADLARARRALRRRRASRMSAGSGLVAAAAIGAFVIVGPSSSPSGHDSAVPGKSSSSVALAAYTGKQPTGFILDKVPVGWAIRDNTPGVLTIAPEGSTPVSGPAGATSLVGTIAVMTERDTGVPTGVELDHVTVGDSPAVIAHMLGSGDTRTLFGKQPSGAYLVIQVWNGLGWDNAKIAEFASSVHITKDAQLGVG